MPTAGRPVPVSTYRLQLTPRFGFADAAAAVPYLARLGVTHVYCSPYLQAAPGSQHGYDVVDHARLSAELGGPPAFAELSRVCRDEGLGLLLDVVPNHMAVSEPESQNVAWWSLLRDGRSSPYAPWFDVDWDAQDGKVLVPVLGAPLRDCLDELQVDGDRIRYYDHELPLAPGSLVEGDLLATLGRQHYRLCFWRVASEELNIRRFFDVTTLAGVRVEVPEVFHATHALILEQVREGVLDGLRIDHPDGLADPGGYLERLAEATGGAWVVVEKILEPGEELPDGWACAGTTGYDALNRVMGLFVDPGGEQPLTDLWHSVTGDTSTWQEVTGRTKRYALSTVLSAEVNRLVDVALPALGGYDVTHRGLREALVEVLACFDVYRAYLPPSGPADATAFGHVQHAADAATTALPVRAREIELVRRLALAELPCPEFVTRFQQTCGPAMAKGVEDTAFYRYLRLSALCEVGGDPSVFGTTIAAFHAACRAQQQQWPLSMTALSTHDTKRSEDVRARLVLLTQSPATWGEAVTGWSALAHRHGRPDPATEQLIWQSVVGAWPLSADRAAAYVEKATREAKAHTSWTDPDKAYDDRVAGFVRAVLADEQIVSSVEDFVQSLDAAWQTTALAQKLVQLTMPGVADTYQGTELWDLSLVDPDNRRPVDYAERLALLDSGAHPKLRVVSTALHLRREHPEWFAADASYEAVDAGERAVAFCRTGQVVTVAPIRALQDSQDADTVVLPAGRWRDLLGGGTHEGTVALADLLAQFPVALLVRAS